MTSARETGGVHPSVCVRGGGGAAVEETLVTHAERVTGGKRSCEGAAVTACTVAGRVGVAHCGGNMTPAKSAVMPQEHARR